MGYIAQDQNPVYKYFGDPNLFIGGDWARTPSVLNTTAGQGGAPGLSPGTPD